MIETNPKAAKFREVTPKIFDIISRVTGTEPNNLLTINFVGLGRLLMKFNNEVLFISLQFKLINLSTNNLHSILSFLVSNKDILESS